MLMNRPVSTTPAGQRTERNINVSVSQSKIKDCRATRSNCHTQHWTNDKSKAFLSHTAMKKRFWLSSFFLATSFSPPTLAFFLSFVLPWGLCSCCSLCLGQSLSSTSRGWLVSVLQTYQMASHPLETLHDYSNQGAPLLVIFNHTTSPERFPRNGRRYWQSTYLTKDSYQKYKQFTNHQEKDRIPVEKWAKDWTSTS